MNRNFTTSSPVPLTPLARVRELISQRRLPVLLLLAGALTMTPGPAQGAGVTGCYLVPSSVRISGGFAKNVTVVNPEANGGFAVANAPGGDDNLALGFLGNASAGNGGKATAAANGGAITLGDINAGGNVGNVIRFHSYLPVSCAALSSWLLVNGGSSNALPPGLVVSGGASSNVSTISPEANGGVAIANAAGGDGNLALGILGDASAGNGGTANAQANGGAISLGNVNSGGNVGNVIQGDGPTNSAVLGISGSGTISGGASSNATTITPAANGGIAAANAPGGSDNLAVGVLGDAAAGNGGTADASANGGSIAIGDVSSGQNVGNVIDTGP